MPEQTASLEKLKSTYPHDVKLSDGTQANLHILGRDDEEGIVEFARNLPVDDLLFFAGGYHRARGGAKLGGQRGSRFDHFYRGGR